MYSLWTWLINCHANHHSLFIFTNTNISNSLIQFPSMESLENRNPPSLNIQQNLEPTPPLRKTIMVASIAAGIQFGWALQLSLLTPYVQLLGIPHKWASLIWLCGPISGMLVQPVVGYNSDRCTSRFGRRRPFIAAGAGCVALSVVLIGFAADIGHMAGDTIKKGEAKPRAIAVFVVGFWILDVANNMLQGPCRAFLADLSCNNPKKMAAANSFFSFFMAVGNVLGYAAGSYTKLYKILPFTHTKACDVYCANLKSCFIISIALLLSLTITALIYVSEIPWSPDAKKSAAGEDMDDDEKRTPCFGEVAGAFKELKKPMWFLLLVTCLNWIAWFPFILFDTDWMGREVYGGSSSGSAAELNLYDRGVRAGSLGLMLNSIVLGVVSLGIEVLGRGVGGVKRLWAIVNFLLAICLALTVLITKLAESHRRFNAAGDPLQPDAGIQASALTLFSILGIPLAITYSVPFALASIFSSSTGAGQGLSLGVLNLSIVIPQMLISLVSGPWDALFGGGNLPAFVVGAIAAAASGICAFTLLPNPSADDLQKSKAALSGGFH